MYPRADSWMLGLNARITGMCHYASVLFSFTHTTNVCLFQIGSHTAQADLKFLIILTPPSQVLGLQEWTPMLWENHIFLSILSWKPPVNICQSNIIVRTASKYQCSCPRMWYHLAKTVADKPARAIEVLGIRLLKALVTLCISVRSPLFVLVCLF